MKYLLEENKKHGEPMFPICLYDVDHSFDSGSILPCHWHEETEILYISSGSAVFHIEDRDHMLVKGQCLFVNGGELHSAYTSTGCHYYALVFHPSFLGGISTGLCESRYINPLILKHSRITNFIQDDSIHGKNIISLVKNMIEKLKEKNNGYELFVKGSLLLFLSHAAEGGLLLQRNEKMTKTGREQREKIKAVIAYIENNYAKKIKLDELAGLAGMNRYNLCRFFKSYTKLTPIEYLNLHRVNEANQLLQTGCRSVTDAALQTGFENMSYFSKVFRRYKNVNPSTLIRG